MPWSAGFCAHRACCYAQIRLNGRNQLCWDQVVSRDGCEFERAPLKISIEETLEPFGGPAAWRVHKRCEVIKHCAR